MERTVFSLLTQLYQELRTHEDISGELEKMYETSMSVQDFNTAGMYEYTMRKLYDEERELRIAINVIEERVS